MAAYAAIMALYKRILPSPSTYTFTCIDQHTGMNYLGPNNKNWLFESKGHPKVSDYQMSLKNAR